MRTELCRAEHRALLFWIQTGDGGQGVHWNLRARVFFSPAKTTTGVPRRGGAPCRLTCCALPVAARACSLNEMLLNGDLRLAALAVSVASTRAWPGKKAWRTRTGPCAGGGRIGTPGLTSWLRRSSDRVSWWRRSSGGAGGFVSHAYRSQPRTPWQTRGVLSALSAGARPAAAPFGPDRLGRSDVKFHLSLL